MADTYTWLNTSGLQNWATAADWAPATGPPVAGDTVIFDGNENGYTDGSNFNDSAPTANVPVGVVNVTITGTYTYTSIASSEVDAYMTIDALVVNNAGSTGVGMETGCGSIDTDGEVTNKTGNDLTISGNILIQSTGSINPWGDGLGTGFITCNTCTNNGTITIGGDAGIFVVTNALTANTGSLITAAVNGSIDVGSFVTAGASSITLDGTNYFTSSGNFNIADNTITWTIVSGDELWIDGNGSCSLGGDADNLTLDIEADVEMLTKSSIKNLTVGVGDTVDGGDLGFDIYGDIACGDAFGDGWVNTGTITQKGNGSWAISATTIILDEIILDAAITLALTQTTKCAKISVPSGSTISGGILQCIPLLDDFMDLEGSISSGIYILLNANLENSLPIGSSGDLTLATDYKLVQTGALEIDGTTRITSNTTDFLASLEAENCQLNDLILGGAAPIFNKSGRIILSGICIINSIVLGPAANVECSIDFNDCNLYMNGGTLVGTGLLATSNENSSGRVYDALISDLDMSSTNPLLAYDSTDSGGNTNVIFSDGAVPRLINAANYKILADYYSTARNKEILVNGDLFDAVYHVITLNELAQEIDLLNAYWDTYLITANKGETPSNLLTAIQALNNHVVVRGGYTDINEYFDANSGLTIDSTWQDMSLDAGYDISDTYVV